MEEKVLVTYASKYGATAEIAEKIGQTLREAGLETDVMPVKHARNLASYKAVILGSAVYIGAWRKEAVRFLQLHEQTLAQQPVWLFSSGPTGIGNPVTLLQGWRYPNGLQSIINRIQPRDIAVFHGLINENKTNAIEKWMIKNVKAVIGDFRDWNAIATWAGKIAQSLKSVS